MYEFRLTPAYCLFNGVGVLEQHGRRILFIVENLEDVVLQGRLSRSFEGYLKTVVERDDCPEYFKGNAQIEFVQGDRNQIRRCVSELYKSTGNERNNSSFNVQLRQKEAAAVLLLDSILNEAREKKATDIHIEGNNIRLRVAGKLEQYMTLQLERSEELIQRIKLLAGMNVIEKRKSQDGRFVFGNSNPIFVRVSVVIIIGENQEGVESLVLRLLDTSRIPLTLNFLGFNEQQLMKIESLEMLKNGLVLVCGPTGSGKSTTIASMLVNLVMRTNGHLKIISMEDPPEYVIPGVSQIQIDEKSGNSFDEILSHIFRQDPDVIMIGEIRDEKSAFAAIRAALTGHLVFATLHTGGAGESVLRLENLGVERKLLASVLRGVISQELDFAEGRASLCADVAIPKMRFGSVIRNDMSEEEMEQQFMHCTNFSEVLSRTFNRIGRGETVQLPLWIGAEDEEAIHKKIV